MDPLSLLAVHMDSARVPSRSDKVYKEECIFSFDSPVTPTGLYVCLQSFLGFGKDFVLPYSQQTGRHLFLHLQREKIPIPVDQQGDGPEKKITRLAIGVDGGFDPDSGRKKFDIKDHQQIVILPEFVTIPWPNDDLPDKIKASVNGILEAQSVTEAAELESLTGTWDGEVRVPSKHASNLVQLDNGRKIPPSGWKCEKCDLDTNLWLNLTDGSILCGRKFFDGSGGNDHAVEHYRTSGYPLAVKLGTITKDGKADVFSYDEDDMVEDPHLKEHLAHWGINIANMEKTEKSMLELELSLNQKMGEWFTLQESGSQLRPLYGPGYTGLANLGNSCYLNSVMQVMFAIPDFVERFVDEAPIIFHNIPADPSSDFNLQMAKLGTGILSGKYSKAPPEDSKDTEQEGISPVMFKNLIGRNSDFATKRQQDAQEFFLHLVNTLERNCRNSRNPADCFKFRVEERYECSESKKVQYQHRAEYSLPLPIPLEAATNKEEVAAYEKSKKDAEEKGVKLDNVPIVRPRIKLSSCLDSFTQSESINGFFSTACQAKVTANKTTRLATFPDYLLIHLKKFTIQEDWTPKKLDVAVEVPDELDLSALRGLGMQAGEEALPEHSAPPPAPVYDESLVSQLLEMGFPRPACEKALYFTNNTSMEAATNWIMEHIGDPDLSDPFVPPGHAPAAGKDGFVANEESVAQLMNLGFSQAHAVKALKATDNALDRAADWVFSHPEELDDDMASGSGQSAEPEFRDGSSQYRLAALISHMGTSTMVGHYVCHIRRDGQWVIYNDNKVAVSENPPKELGYLYLYERVKSN
ncbi:ubiquitin carboxyl-terminal hydrolase 5 [Thrips palmi]|uniref:Ubiquitin carboxyl-terminal hydrolase n=1 Tax=Thrips palmi TaxID=161013 RepID=A0A6P8Z7V9_THRPL|nr:ubiquitin carboxyl-terminal hydrolase 5 [Thrips palmi]